LHPIATRLYWVYLMEENWWSMHFQEIQNLLYQLTRCHQEMHTVSEDSDLE